MCLSMELGSHFIPSDRRFVLIFNESAQRHMPMCILALIFKFLSANLYVPDLCSACGFGYFSYAPSCHILRVSCNLEVTFCYFAINYFQTATFVYSCLSKLLPANFHSYFELNASIHNRGVRSKSNIFTLCPKKYTGILC